MNKIVEQFVQIKNERNYSYRKLNQLTSLPFSTINEVIREKHIPKKQTLEKIELFVLRTRREK
uniref:Uncharacterized protein n=1 Tax=viral metagenome TaxID=1070528 RepID=A0A6H1ZEL9_9ZZZZ